jgi:hypothetical protein
MAEHLKMLGHGSILEISGVKRAANRKRFAVTKSESTTMSIISAVLATKAEGEEQFVATLKSEGADEKRIEAATAMFRMNKGFADILEQGDLEKAGIVAKAHKEPDGDEMEQEEDETDEAFKARKAKKAAKAAKSAAQVVAQPVRKSAEVVEDPRLEQVMKSNQALMDQVKGLVEKNQMMEFTTKAEREFSHVPGKSTAEIALALKAAHDVGGETEKTILASLRSVEQLVAKSAMLGEIGVSGSGMATGGAHQKLVALASGLTMKSESGKEMTPAQKYAYVAKNTAEGRDLYAQYLAEQAQAQKNR